MEPKRATQKASALLQNHVPSFYHQVFSTWTALEDVEGEEEKGGRMESTTVFINSWPMVFPSTALIGLSQGLTGHWRLWWGSTVCCGLISKEMAWVNTSLPIQSQIWHSMISRKRKRKTWNILKIREVNFYSHHWFIPTAWLEVEILHITVLVFVGFLLAFSPTHR